MITAGGWLAGRPPQWRRRPAQRRRPRALARCYDEAGAAWSARAGGTSGALWGAALDAAGRELGDQGATTSSDLVAAVGQAYAAIAKLGKARRGDKTMLDALSPFGDAFAGAVANGSTLAAAWQVAARMATTAAGETAQLRPRVGRARPLAERSVGTPRRRRRFDGALFERHRRGAPGVSLR